MMIGLFSSTLRYSLAVAAAVLAIATLIAVKRGSSRAGAALGVATLAAVGALAGEGLVALTVKLAAPGAADFNDHRWVFLSPWGRLGLYLGGAAVVGIVLLSWRASRGAPVWQSFFMLSTYCTWMASI